MLRGCAGIHDLQVLHVKTGTEGRPGAGEDDNTAVAGLRLVQGLCQLLDQLRTQRIPFFRPIQGNSLYPVFRTGQNVVETCHGDLLPQGAAVYEPNSYRSAIVAWRASDLDQR